MVDNVENIDNVEVVDVSEKTELPEDLKNTLDELKRKYGIEDETAPSDASEDAPVIEKVLSNNVKNLSRTLHNDGEITTPNGTIHYRKWRVKDKKALEASRTLTDMKYALVLNCIEYKENEYKFALDNEEVNFLLHNIRRESVHKPLKHTFVCPECGHTCVKEINLDDIVTTVGGEYEIEGKVTVGPNNIEFGNPGDQEIYNEFMSLDDPGDFQLFIMDMILHIKKFNDIEVSNRDDLIKVIKEIDELESDVADELVEKWNDIRYKVIIDNKVECPECYSANKFNFEDLPGFYPSSWNDWDL